MDSVKVGIVGLGRMAQRVHIPSLLEMNSAKIVAGCDANENVLKQTGSQYKIPSLYSNYVEMAEKSDVDAVFVLTKPDDTHPAITNLFLENGKDVFCEKPMAMELVEAEEMVKKAKRNGRILTVGFNRRYAPVYKEAKEMLKGRRVEVVLSEIESFMPSQRALFTGWIHSVDILRWFCGEPRKIQSFARYKDPLFEENIVSLINFDSEACGLLLFNSKAGQYMERVEIQGEGISVQADFPYTVKANECSKSFYEPVLSRHWTASPWMPLNEIMGYKMQDRHFIDSVKSGEKSADNAEDALRSHKLVDSIYTSCGLPNLG